MQQHLERMQQHLQHSGKRQDELREYIKTTEAHLEVVVTMFERHLREDHGTRPS